MKGAWYTQAVNIYNNYVANAYDFSWAWCTTQAIFGQSLLCTTMIIYRLTTGRFMYYDVALCYFEENINGLEHSQLVSALEAIEKGIEVNNNIIKYCNLLRIFHFCVFRRNFSRCIHHHIRMHYTKFCTSPSCWTRTRQQQQLQANADHHTCSSCYSTYRRPTHTVQHTSKRG